ncbi:MAG: zinc-dependent metalloprotease [Phycisphaeraceae bacterium]|nr:zinc-dependent metalloprotease [Phycisphaeraceae bacterium]
MSSMVRSSASLCALIAAAGLCISMPLTVAVAQPAPDSKSPAEEKPEFPKFADVSKDFTKVVSTADGEKSFYTLWVKEKDGSMLAELPRGFENQRHFIALTVASGESYAGLQAGELYCYWKRFDKRLALIEPEIATRSTGDQESKSGVERLFTDRVVLDVPIVCMGPSGQPVIDLKALMAGQAQKFFGYSAAGANANLAVVKEAKAFPKNVEISYELPTAGGRLKQFHYSVSLMEGTPGYQPRAADERIGYFTTVYRDLGKFRDDEKWVRYVNRWSLEKRDPKLKLSPPKEPIVFYVEHTVPVRYRAYVKQGIDYWNAAFEKVGIRDAIEVRYQDKASGANMDKDPEDVRYNFIRWLTNDVGTAIGPSRVNPLTGEILDADVVLTDGWIRYFWYTTNELIPASTAMEAFTPETIAWLDSHPNWDPRVRMAPPGERDYLLAQRASRGVVRYGGHPAAQTPQDMLGQQEFDGLKGRVSQVNGLCLAAQGKANDMALMGMNMMIMDMLNDPPEDEAEAKDAKKDEKKDKDKEKEKEETLDGIPEWFVGPALADLVAHEVGHTLGLRHNFKASSAYTLKQINSDEFKGKKPFTTSVMDYTPVNINMDDGPIQGDYNMSNIGPYDFWAIEYGYTSGDPKKVLETVADPEHQFGTDEDTFGPDPLAQRYDFSADPLDFAASRMKLVKALRAKITDKFVKEGQSWSKARRGYAISLSTQTQMLAMMSRWVGGAHVYRDKKGDPNGRAPIDVVPAAKQRAAMKFLIENTFTDEAFGLNADLLKYMTVDKWWDDGGMGSIMEDATWPVHDRVMGIQASVLTMMLNPTTLKRVYDNEFRIPADQDALTLPELMDAVSSAIWTEVYTKPSGKFTSRQPMVSSLRRNLQREHLDRLIDLTFPGTMYGASSKPISNLAVAKLKEIRGKIKSVNEGDGASRIDPYTSAHLAEAAVRIDKALEASYVYNAPSFGGMFGGFYFREPDGGRQSPVERQPDDYLNK